MLSTLNIVTNPLVVKSFRERLRIRNALSWGLIVVVVTSFAYAITLRWVTNFSPLGEEGAPKMGLLVLLVIQGVILMLLGTGAVAVGMAQERMGGVLDYQRMTPMSPTAKILGYLFGLPIREYYLFALTMPFLVYAAVRAQVNLANLLQLYLVGFVSVWLYHMTGMVAGMLSPKPWRAGAFTQAMVLLMYFVLPQLSRLGFTFFVYLTVRPVFLRLAQDELESQWNASGALQDWKEYVHFFNLDLHPTIFALLVQGTVLVCLYVIVYRKWRDEAHLPFSKLFSIFAYAATQVALVGSLWPWLTRPERFQEVAQAVERNPVLGRHSSHIGEFVIRELLYVFFAVSTAAVLLVMNMVTPTRHRYAAGLRRAKKLGLPDIPRTSDAASAMLFNFAFILMTCISYAVLVNLAIDSGQFFRKPPSNTALVLMPLMFAALAVYVHAMRELWGLKPWGLALFVIWVVPFFTYALVFAGRGSALAANYIAAIVPVNAFYFAIVNLVPSPMLFDDPEAISGNAIQLTATSTAINLALAIVFVWLVLRQHARLRRQELG